MLFTKDITDAAGLLQLSAGQEAGVEAVIHTVWDIFANEDTEAVLLIDAENAFNFINQKVWPYLNFVCPIITTYITNCYITPSRLFLIAGREILSKEWTTQDDPTAIRAYASGNLPLIHFLFEFITINHLSAKETAFASSRDLGKTNSSCTEVWLLP